MKVVEKNWELGIGKSFEMLYRLSRVFSFLLLTLSLVPKLYLGTPDLSYSISMI